MGFNRKKFIHFVGSNYTVFILFFIFIFSEIAYIFLDFKAFPLLNVFVLPFFIISYHNNLKKMLDKNL
ncbi:MAG: hypothetical protein QXF12_00285 [Candidatus Aenigmatarchaeota archaeon]